MADREKCLHAYIAHRGAKRLKDLDLASASAWLNELRATGLSHRSVNTRYAALAQFGTWLVTARRWAHDPFEGLRPLNEAEDQRHVRRALTPEEAGRLLRAAAERPLRMAEAGRIHAGVSDAEGERLLRLGQIPIWMTQQEGPVLRPPSACCPPSNTTSGTPCREASAVLRPLPPT